MKENEDNINVAEVNENPYGGPLEFQGNPAEKARKMREIYDSLGSIRDKMNFILAADAYYLGGNPNAMESQALQDMKDYFTDQYITNGTVDSCREVYQTLGYLQAASINDMLREKNVFLMLFDENDPDRDAKAEFLMGDTAAKYRSNFIAELTLYDINPKNRDDNARRQKVREEAGITEDTTMEQYAVICGMTTAEEVEDFCARFHSRKGEKVLAYYRENYKTFTEDDIRNKYTDEILSERANHWQLQGKSLFMAHNSISNGKQADINRVFDSFGKEEKENKNIVEWKNSVGEGLAQEFRNKALQDNKKAFVTRHINKYDYDKKQKETSRRRIKGNTEKAYPWAFKRENTFLTDKQKQDFEYDTNWRVTEAPVSEQIKFSKVLGQPKYFDRIKNVFDGQRTTTYGSIFNIWALATQPDITINNIDTLGGRVDLLDKFAEFCKDNPTKTAGTEEILGRSAANWCDMITRATEKLKNSRMPEGDYSDPEEFKKHVQKHYIINHMCVDLLQEKDKLLDNKLGINGKMLLEDKMGGNKWDETLHFWSRLQDAYGFFNSGYELLPQLDTGSSHFVKDLKKTAVNRELAIDIFSRMAGKPVDEGLAACGTTVVRGANTAIDMKAGSADTRASLKSLNGKDRAGYKKQVTQILKKNFKGTIINTNRQSRARFKNFFQSLECDVLMDQLTHLPDTKEATLGFLNNKEKINTGMYVYQPASWLAHNMNQLFNDVYRYALMDAGMRKEDVIRIDGKSPEKLWGEKYRDVPADLKWKCYQLEIMKKLAKGQSELKIRDVTYGLDGKAKPGKYVSVVKPIPDIQKLNAAYEVYKKGVTDIVGQLKTIQGQLLQTHDTEDVDAANEEIGQVGSKLFRNMERTLDACITALEDKDATPAEISKNLSDYRQAADTYYKERYSRFGKRDDKGRTRLETADSGRRIAPDLLMTYENLRKALNSDLMVNEDYTYENAPIGTINLSLTRYYGDKLDPLYKLNETRPSEAEVTEGFQRVKDISAKQVEISNILNAKIESKGTTLSKITENSKKIDEPYDAALAFITDSYKEEMHADGIDLAGLGEIRTGLETAINDGSFDKRVEKLSKNTLFKELLKENKGLNYKAWRKIEKNSDAAVRAMQTNISETLAAHPNIAQYIMDAGKKVRVPAAENVDAAAAAAQKNAMIKKARYERLGELVAKQLLVDPANIVMVEAIEAGKMRFADVIGSVAASLRRQKVLEGSSFSEERLAEKIMNGSLKKKVTESVLNKTKENVKQKPAPAQVNAPTM